MVMIEVAKSTVHGLGAFATRDLTRGDCIGVYQGRRFSEEQAPRGRWTGGPTYVFALSDGSIIDGAIGGNATRHMNHSCMPNCVAQEEDGPGHRLRVALYASRDIQAGEELFLDYSLEIDQSTDPAAFACVCGAPKCRGTMLAEA